ncbi:MULTISPECIES: cardiolipin synthase ClsB [unclassified Pseudomonas]|uniref:cardiolipin synthase ClsB n=1 Tax=unclassified Pseudomonas TaxID=196821 RepID=UPI0011ED8303|nr:MULTISPECIES: cardiolipin synthase ClsB [unclassified Pseudomonas]KAA0944548.1 cardiolipin synthase ClsB [Pseudomonas sp. ANT_H4]KAA0951194.1 cardiolipin synthase ClsB [Pseudomonas sp. ANT_H14]
MSSAPVEKVAVQHIATDQPPDDSAARDLDYGWQRGNQVELLENGEAYFPKVFDALRQAQREILLETFILFEDKVGHELQGILIEAAQRGVKVVVSLDGFGCGELSAAFLSELAEAGVTVQIFDPASKTLGFRTNWFRRLHRKIVVVDATVAFIGGINFSADHLGDFGPEAKQDYSVQVIGPAVADLHHFALAQSGRQVRTRRGWRRREQQPSSWESGVADGMVRLIYRDNLQHRSDIEEAYLHALRKAQRRVVIANAYFFPGYRLLREIRNAARRGVQVQLIMQGQPDVLMAKLAARMLYDYLLKDGVVIHEYCDRPLHGKVALVDEQWSTVGSSNLDPLSLSLNLEANVLIRDRVFNQQLFERLQVLSKNHCTTMPENRTPRGWLWRVTVGFVVFHVLRHFPVWIGSLPAHKPRLKPFVHEHTGSQDHDSSPRG